MLRTIYAISMFAIYMVFTIIVDLPIVLILGEKKGEEYAEKKAKRWGKFLIRVTGSKVNIKIKDPKKLDEIKNKPIVVIANHQSNVDIPLLMGYFPRHISFVAKKEMETWPIMGMWMKRLHCIFLDRKNRRAAMQSIKKGINQIKNGDSVVIFPEGTRSKTGKIGNFKKGSFKLATEPGVHIVPVTIDGTIDVMGKGEKKISSSKINMIIHKPIDTSQMERGEKKELAEKVREIIKKDKN
ncbi:MAG: lysophospholipid acyltransferase family protein [Fusobacteriota bacterium]